MSDLELMFGLDPRSPSGDPEPPEPLEVVTTPSGIEISFQTEPKRLYKIRHKAVDGGAWKEVPSATQALDVLHKEGLPWWGMKVGVEGVLELKGRGQHNILDHETDGIIKKLTESKLTVNHVKHKAARRGTSVHRALETWATEEILPEPGMWPEEEQGYVTALRSFIDDSLMVPQRCEVMVGSFKHGFAGRFDLHCWSIGNEVCTYLTKAGRGDKRTVLEPGFGLIDLKTSSGVYPSHALQLAAYELAAVECGYEPTDFRAVLHCCSDGRYELRETHATAEDFLAVLAVYNVLKGKLV